VVLTYAQGHLYFAVGKRSLVQPRRRLTWKVKLTHCEVNGAGSESCPVAGFVISGVEPPGSATQCVCVGCLTDTPHCFCRSGPR